MRALALILSCLAAPALALDCGPVVHEGNRYTICEAAPAKDTLRLYRADPEGRPYGEFFVLKQALSRDGKALVFAMNAGMYHADRRPVGHYVEDGSEEMPVISTPGPGNFGLLPNGVFCIRAGRADVFETRDYLIRKPQCSHATQSGPMLVIDGALHPRFLENSPSRYIRNGVGASLDGGRVVFAISDHPVNFHAFARLFRDALDLPNALYLDGNVSRLYARELGRSDLGRPMGPILAIIRDE